MRSLAFKHVLTGGGIIPGCRLDVDDAGRIRAISGSSGPFDGDLALPGMPNAHSHAFQRALAGWGEARRGDDSFWSWREAMYSLAHDIDPERMHAIATLAYREMLGAGYTSVAEFHYLHHLPDGTPGTAMADAVVAAARDTGIRLRLLPVYYHSGGFGEPATDAQRRFIHRNVDDFLKLVDDIDHADKGVAAHSLRAVPLPHLKRLADARSGPVHIHISEQESEVAQCVAALGKRPVEALADTVELDHRWTLVHATHANEQERQYIIDAGAVVALCPLTEAYLGDGLFEATAYHQAAGHFSIGSDSNVRIDAAEELRLLEYGQRLRDRRRARLADEHGIGLPLWRDAAAGGARSVAFDVGEIAVGRFADLVVLDGSAAPFTGLPVERWLDAWVTGGSRHDIAATYVGGVQR